MPNINDINGVTVANLAKLDAVLKANISKVNGLTLAAAFTGLLDTYTGAAAAYSTRRLYGQYTGAALRVREDSGDTETDIGFDSNGDLDTAAIATHCGSANGYVVTWYGQESSGGTGSGNDAEQSTAGNQPQIYDGTAVITENGKPAVMFETGQGSPHMTISSITPRSQFAVVKTSNAEQNSGILQPDNPVLNYDKNGNLKVHQTTISIGASNPLDQKLVSSIADGASSQHHVNDESSTTAVSTYYSGSQLGGRTSQSNRQCVPLQEYVTYTTVVSSSDYTGIRNNINSDYLIYQPTDAPTSGLLATYTGAAAAYSVRQLSNKAVIAMRIRRDSDDEERNIGFDSNGDLATADISAFCGTANGYVVEWADQSTNGNHATQSTAGSQPQIYNGTAVITENGKPCLKFDSDKLGELTLSLSQPFTSTFVMASNGGSDTFATVFGSRDGTGVKGGFLRRTTNWWMQSASLADTGQAHDTSQHLFYSVWDGASSEFAQDGATATTLNPGTTDWTNLAIAARGTDTFDAGANGNYQELIIWSSDQSSNRTGIESDINTYFSIY